MRVKTIGTIFLVVSAFVVGIFSSNLSGFSSYTGVTPAPFSQATVAFCPSPECTFLPLSALDSAQSRVWVAMYSFTNEDFANALIRARERGVDVRVVVEKQQAGSQYSKHRALSDAGIFVRIDSNPNYMHHKFAVIDDSILINGSMNWSGNGVGENNENVSIIHSPEINSLFSNEFEKIWVESDAFP